VFGLRRLGEFFYVDAVPGLDSCRGLVRLTLISAWV
jgi:hypothetical protein